MNKTGRRLLVLLLCAAMVFELSACWNKKVDGEEETLPQTGGQNAVEADGGSGKTQEKEDAHAAGQEKDDPSPEEPYEDGRWAMPQAGVRLGVVPESYRSDEVYISTASQELGSGVTYASVVLAAVTEEELFALDSNDPEQMAQLQDKLYDLFRVMGVNGGRGESELKELLADYGIETEFTFEKLGEAGDYVFYRASSGEDRCPVPPAEKREIVERILADTPAVIEGLCFEEPVLIEETAEEGVLSFETTDLDGNPVSSEELFGNNKITVVNLWVSWCGPCIMEMPELNAFNQRIQEKDCEVVGILIDGNQKEALAEGIDLVEETGAEYLMLKPFAGVDWALPVQAFPTTYFVDSEGRLLGRPIVGASVPLYEERLEELLEEME